jgi:hypothetical protein
MRTISPVIGFALMGIACFVFVVHAQMVPHGFYSITQSFGGKRFTSIVTREQASRTPIWSAQQDSPPLSARTAEKNAIAKCHKILANANSWRVNSIILQSPWDNTNWFYTVEFVPEAPLSQRASLDIIVLMNGTVIEPIVTDTN